ncbi:hypothetical protein BDB01DRAFT_459894 [Pilobolus umbonatus]|nr:hypothetical protein BDB01DRAFT_459894 [Pilobolus umbonatus]
MPDTTPFPQQLHISETTTESTTEKNEDYQSVLKSLDILRRQLKIATEDIERLNTLKHEALSDPYTFIMNIKNKTSNKIPKLQKIVRVPEINWNKYGQIPDSRLMKQAAMMTELTQYYTHHSKRSAYRNILDTPMAPEYHSPPVSMTTKNLQSELYKATQSIRQLPSRANSVSDFSDDDDTESMSSTSKTDRHKVFSGKGKGKRRTSTVYSNINRDLRASSLEEVESRVKLQSIEPRISDEPMSIDSYDEQKASFKQPWTDEEQQRLQELLIVYPDEPIQAQRFNKISKALGTRTPKQVASRVQKYFIKLAKLGLPVPGRITIPPSCMSKGEKNGTKPKLKSKVKSTVNGRVTKPIPKTSGMGYNSMVSGGITKSRISGAHYATLQGPPTVYMSEDEEDTNVTEMMRQVVKPENNVSE